MMSFAGLTLECGGVTEWPNVPVLKTLLWGTTEPPENT